MDKKFLLFTLSLIVHVYYSPAKAVSSDDEENPPGLGGYMILEKQPKGQKRVGHADAKPEAEQPHKKAKLNGKEEEVPALQKEVKGNGKEEEEKRSNAPKPLPAPLTSMDSFEKHTVTIGYVGCNSIKVHVDDGEQKEYRADLSEILKTQPEKIKVGIERILQLFYEKTQLPATRIIKFLKGSKKHPNKTAKYLIFKQYSHEEADVLSKFFDEYYQFVEKIEKPKNTSNFTEYYKKLDNLAEKSNIFERGYAENGQKKNARNFGTFRANPFEPPLWKCYTKKPAPAPVNEHKEEQKPNQNLPFPIGRPHLEPIAPTEAQYKEALRINRQDTDYQIRQKNPNHKPELGKIEPVSPKDAQEASQIILKYLKAQNQKQQAEFEQKMQKLNADTEKNMQNIRRLANMNQGIPNQGYLPRWAKHGIGPGLPPAPPQGFFPQVPHPRMEGAPPAFPQVRFHPQLPDAQAHPLGNRNPNPPKSNPQHDVQANWKYNLDEIRDATEGELKLYEDILQEIETHPDLTDSDKKVSRSTIRRFKELHKNNKVVCEDIITFGVNYGVRLCAEEPKDILLHPEKSDASLEQRAHIFYNVLESTWVAIKDKPALKKRFFKEAFINGILCLEVQSKKIDKWRMKYMETQDLENIMQKKTKAENIRELAQPLYEAARQQSEADKKYHQAQKDKDTISSVLEDKAKLDKLDEIIPGLSFLLKNTAGYIDLSLPHYDDGVETWLIASKKYQTMQEEVFEKLLGKTSSDGIITEEDIQKVLVDDLLWPLKSAEGPKALERG